MPPALQCDQNLGIIEAPFIAAHELMLKIDDPFTSSLYFTDQRQTNLAVPANFFRLVQIGVFGKGNLDRISGGEPYSSVWAWWIRQRRWGRLTSSAGERCNRY